MRPRIFAAALALLTLMLLRPCAAEPTPPPPPDANGLIVGVSAWDRPDETQLDATRNIRVYTFLYNNSPVPRVIDWRTRRLHSHKLSAQISRHDYYGTFIIQPGEVILMKSFFYYHTGFPGKFTFSVRDIEGNDYSVPVQVQATNVGPFSSLPAEVQQHLIDVFLDNQMQFKWWYRAY
jgi:hypothetical protein